MYSEGEKLKQLKIYFLFMYADGEASSSEAKYLDDILAKSGLSEESVQELRDFCEQKALKLLTEKSKTVITEIDELLREDCFWPFGSINDDKTMQAQTIWTLINLGYADSKYSEPEKEIVNHLVERWEMDPVLVAEFHDTADTILALTLQKDWVRTSSKPQADIDSIIQELDRNIDSMFANVEISISEADIA